MISDLELLAVYGHQRCEKCGKNKLISRFAAYGERIHNHCNSCRTSRIPSCNKVITANQKVIEAARSQPCKDCNQTFPPVCMDFDHLPQYKKSFNVSSQWKLLPTQKIIDEIAKCEVVCSNCHRIRTASRPHKRGFGSNQVTVLYPPAKDPADAIPFTPRPEKHPAKQPRAKRKLHWLQTDSSPPEPYFSKALMNLRKQQKHRSIPLVKELRLTWTNDHR